MEIITLLVAEEDALRRIDSLLQEKIEGLSRSAAQRLLAEGMVEVGGKKVPKNFRPEAGERIEVRIPEPVPAEAQPEPIPLEICYEDSDLLVVNKTKGMVVHPAAGHPDGTLVNALLAHCGDSLSGVGGVLRPGIVHRLDKDTSGLLIVAKNDRAHRCLAGQIKEHSFLRIYETIVTGRVRQEEGRIEAAVGRHPVHRKKMAVTDKNGKSAVSEYKVLGYFQGFTHMQVRLFTGRTHQIRVHMAHIGHPVAGDTVYGSAKNAVRSFEGQCLHARTVGFLHPEDGRHMEFTSELPQYFLRFLDGLRRNGAENFTIPPEYGNLEDGD